MCTWVIYKYISINIYHTDKNHSYPAAPLLETVDILSFSYTKFATDKPEKNGPFN